MLPVLLLAMILGAPGLNADAIWIDELTTIGHAGGLTGPFSPFDVLESVREISPKHTPLFFELTAAWGALVGWHHAALRVLPLFFGIIALAWIYRIGKDFAGWRLDFGRVCSWGLTSSGWNTGTKYGCIRCNSC